MARTRDIYGRKATSHSRGRTHERILAMEHPPDIIPGTEGLLADAPPGSIAAALIGFHQDWVCRQRVSPRRAYERTIALLVRDLAAAGPALAYPADSLTPERLAAHVRWRRANRIADPGEFKRLPVHLERIADALGVADPAGVREAVCEELGR